MTLARRKHLELRQKLRGLAEELAHWQWESGDGKPLRLHRTQIASVAGLGPVQESTNKAPLARLWREVATRVRETPPKPEAEAAFLDAAADAEYLLLGAHTVWGYFREKLAQRYTPRSREFLALADELAWACYQPARHAAHGKQAPPLTYLAFIERLGPGESDILTSPALWSRGGTDWLPPGTPAIFQQPIPLKKVLAPLAIPVLGLPWVQASHLPDLPVIAHEVGHAVEEDFQLSGELEIAIAAALAEARAAGQDPGPDDAWQAWRGELFADCHGLAHLGPGFVSTLTDLLSSQPDRTKPEDRSLGSYPTHGLRLRINRAALGELGFQTSAHALSVDWRTAAPADPASPEFDDAIPYIVRHLLRTRLTGLGGKNLMQLGDWNPHRRTALAQWSNPANPLAVTTRDTRVVTSALRAIYDQDPAGFVPQQSARWSEALALCQPPTGTRGAVHPLPDSIDLAALLFSAAR